MDVDVARQQIGCLLKRRIVRKRLVVEYGLFFRYGDGLEEESFATHLDVHIGEIPVPGAHFLLLHKKVSVFVQMTE